MARRSQCSSAGDNPLDPNYLPPHYREEYRIAIDALVEEDLEGYYKFLQKADVVDFLSTPEIQYIQGSVQVPLQSHHPEQQFLETEGDGSSDTYWPLHSDLEVPGLDLGWPQLHHFIGPTEVTTLVNPPEPDMPSIKEQARRLIKNAQQVIAVVMDMFTDVDIFADILNAAMRSVAVYIILDEQNAHHFLNMASNCRVNLQSIQFLRVRTVSGITYHCRSGKSFKGQLMDRFLFTDCRAVLSGNYSFMWSFEKLHRCMAHLFLGQFVSTFDEEFRILFAQSEPLMTENVLGPMDDFGPLLKRQYPSERTCLYREPRKFLSLDTSHPEERIRHPHDERMDVDWRMMHLKRQEFLQGPADMYTRPPPQQSRMDLPYDQGPPRINTMENPGFKRHSYAEGVHGRFSYPFLQQQGIPDPDIQGRQFHRGQQQYPGPITGPETDYSSYDKFWSQDYQSADQYSEPVLPQEMQPPDNFDPVHNYLSSTRNVDFDQSSEKLLPVADLPFSSSHPRRLSFSQLYGCQTSPTPSNPTDQKQFFQEPTTDRKDPSVKRGLRNWRISSYLSAYDNPGDEGLPLAPPQAGEPFEEPLIPTQQTAPVIDLSLPKIPNVREFKVPAVPRASQLPTYIKSTVREQPKKLPDEPTAVAVEITTPSPSESSSTAEGEKVEEAEPKEPKITALQMEKSFRRKYNVTTPRSSRLRSSLIFSSLDQQHSQDSKTAQGQQDEDSDKNEAEQTKLPFMSQVLGQRRSTTREPFEWSRYIKSATTDNSATETPDTDDGNSKADGENTSKVEDSKDPSENCGLQESLQPPDVELANSSPSTPRTKPSEAELPKTDQPLQVPKLLFTTPYVDMSDPDTRLMFFKELAAKRKAAKAAEAEKSQVKAQMTPVDLKKGTTVKMEECEPKEASEKLVATASPSEGLSEKNVATDDAGKIVSAAECESVSLSLEASDRTQDQAGLVKNDPCTSQSCKEEQTTVSTESENKEQKNSQPATALPVSVETESHPKSECHEDIMLTKPAVNESGPTYPPTSAISNIATVSSLEQGANESEIPSCDSTSKESSSLTPHLVEVPPPSASAVLISNTQNLQQELLDTRISEPAPEQSEQLTESELRCSDPSVQSSSAKHIPNTDPRPQISSSSQILSMTIHSTPEETSCSNVTPDHSRSTHFPSALSQNYDKAEALETVSPLAPSELSQTVDKTSAESELLQAHVEPVSQLSSAETPPPNDGSACAESHFSANICAAPTEPKTSSSQSTTKTTSEDSCAHTPSEYVLDVLKSENSSLPKTIVEATEVLGSSEDVKSENTPPSHCLSSVESGFTKASDLEMSPSLPEQFGILDLQLPSDDIPSDTCSSVIPDITNETDQSTSNGSTQDTLTHATPPSEPNLTGSVTVTPVKTETPSSPLTELVEPVLSPEADKTETSISTKCSPLHTLSLPEQFTADSNETSVLCSTETLLPTEPTSEIPTEPEPTPDSVISESCDPEPSEPAETSKIDQQNEISEEPELSDSDEITPEDIESTNKVNSSLKQESVIRENTNNQIKPNICSKLAEITSNELVPPPSQSKLPKTSQSRYQSSTANVLSSSNLRDDTKLLLEQISANSQSRNEATKESPVTDDEKEDEADKNAKRENERGMRTFIRGPPQSTQEREKLLERIQSMRKERKVYSRFEMAP